VFSLLLADITKTRLHIGEHCWGKYV